jgi:hypothetical protein
MPLAPRNAIVAAQAEGGEAAAAAAIGAGLSSGRGGRGARGARGGRGGHHGHADATASARAHLEAQQRHTAATAAAVAPKEYTELVQARAAAASAVTEQQRQRDYEMQLGRLLKQHLSPGLEARFREASANFLRETLKARDYCIALQDDFFPDPAVLEEVFVPLCGTIPHAELRQSLAAAHRMLNSAEAKRAREQAAEEAAEEKRRQLRETNARIRSAGGARAGAGGNAAPVRVAAAPAKPPLSSAAVGAAAPRPSTAAAANVWGRGDTGRASAAWAAVTSPTSSPTAPQPLPVAPMVAPSSSTGAWGNPNRAAAVTQDPDLFPTLATNSRRPQPKAAPAPKGVWGKGGVKKL